MSDDPFGLGLGWAGGGGFVGAGPQLVLIDRTAGTNIGNMTTAGGLAAAFDGNNNQADIDCAALSATTVAYVGKTLASGKRFGQALAYGSNASGYSSAAGALITLDILGKQGAAPATPADGTVVGTTGEFTENDTAQEKPITSTDLATVWDHLWLRVTRNGANSTLRVAELILYEWA